MFCFTRTKNSKAQIVMNSKTQIVMTLKNSHGDDTQQLKLC